MDVVIAGSNFQSGATASFSGAGIAVSSTTFNSSTSLTAHITVDPAAALGAPTITVTNPDTNQGTGGTFTVLSASAPTIDTVTISTLGQNATNINVAMVGSNFDATSTITVGGTGVTASTTFSSTRPTSRW
jgi:hypothetical protein